MKNLAISSILKGALIGVSTAIIGILILAGVERVFSLSEIGIKTANQFIKTITIFLGCISSLKSDKGMIRGLLIGTLFCVVLHLMFLIIGSSVGIKRFFIDFIFCSVVGIISGIISVNVRHNYDI